MKVCSILDNLRHTSTTILNKIKAQEIRELYKTGNYLQREIAKKYNVSRYTYRGKNEIHNHRLF